MASNHRQDLRELTRQVASSLPLPESDNRRPSTVMPVQVSSVRDSPMTDVEWYQELLGAGMVPENRVQLWLAGDAPYLVHHSSFATDERGLPRPRTVRQLLAIDCGHSLDGKQVRYAGRCRFCRIDCCSDCLIECPICRFGTCPYCDTEWKGQRVHRWHLGLRHPVRTVSNLIWKATNKNS